MNESAPAAAVMRLLAFTTLAVNRKQPTKVFTYQACKYTETKHPWLLAKLSGSPFLKTLLNAFRVWLMAPCLYISPSVTPVFISQFASLQPVETPLRILSRIAVPDAVLQ